MSCTIFNRSAFPPSRPPISNYSRPLIKPLGIIPIALFTIDIFVTFMYHSCFSSLARSKYLSLFSVIFTLLSDVAAKSTFRQVLAFFYGIRGSVCISKPQRIICVLFSKTNTLAVRIPFTSMVKFQLLAQF